MLEQSIDSMLLSKQEVWLGQTIVIPFQENHPNINIVGQIWWSALSRPFFKKITIYFLPFLSN